MDPDEDDTAQTGSRPGEEPPFNTPDDVPDRLGDTHPETDTGLDETETYNDNVGGAADAELPHESAVIGYESSKDKRLHDQAEDEFDKAAADEPPAAA